jgi:excisionase family DNA binding protein
MTASGHPLAFIDTSAYCAFANSREAVVAIGRRSSGKRERSIASSRLTDQLYANRIRLRRLSIMERVQEREILTPEQVADYLQVRKDTVYRYIRDGKLPAVRLGRSYRVPRENLDLFLLANSTQTGVREALFQRVLQIAGKAPDVPLAEVERDVADAVAAARRPRRA